MKSGDDTRWAQQIQASQSKLAAVQARIEELNLLISDFDSQLEPLQVRLANDWT